MKRNCLLCGDEFFAKEERNIYCKKKHYKECPVCKESFLLVRNRDKLTCSSKCASDYRNANVRYDCICKVCGKSFKGKTKRANVCEDKHYNKCEICDKKYELADSHRPSRFCSPSCQAIVTHTPKAKENRRKKSLERHGTEFPFQAENVKIKIKETLDNSENDMRVGSKRWKEMLNEKYGVKNISQVQEIKEQKERTYMEKFGVKNPAGIHIENYEDWYNFERFILDKNWDCLEIAKYFKTSVCAIRGKAKNLNLEHLIKDFYKYSNHELEVKHILLAMGLKESVDFKPHYRQLIKPLEVDFYIPKLKLAIEVSPTFTHSVHETFLKPIPLEKDYHKRKFELCREKGVFLITIFEWHTIEDLEKAIKNHIEVLKEETRSEVILDLSLENPEKYKKLGYKKTEEYPPKLFYHKTNRQNVVIKSNKTIRKHKKALEKNKFLPIYNCGYEKWVLE